ncbi:Putative WD-repeat family protein [Giardia duodenalis]|uniref:Putative WD-repeat family protein n=1 Tax=Giardia intestinalis TaxID=5741 RepID=V6TKH8_GIAIN|nr:Putative WD-repeat family protein [Giardia intestinalis]
MTQPPALSTLQTIRTSRIKAVDFHCQQPWVVQGLFSGELALYDWAVGRVLKTISVCPHPIRAVRFLPKTSFLLVGSDDGVLRLYESGSLQKRAEVTAHSDCIRAIEIHPTSDETVVFTGGDDGVIRVWSLNSQATGFNLEQELHGHAHFVMSLCIDPAGLKLISGSMDSTIKAWDVSRLVNMESFRAKATIAADAPAVGVLQTNFSTYINDEEDRGLAMTYATLAAQGLTRAIGTVLKRGRDDGYTSTDDMKTLMPKATAISLFTLFGHEQGVNSVCWCESLNNDVTSNPYYTGGLQYIASGSDDTTIRIWDTHSRAVVREFDHHSASVSCVSYVTGSSYLLAVAEDNNLSIINTTSMTLERTMNYSLGRMWAVSYNFDVSGVYAAIGCDQGLAVVRIGESTLKYASYDGSSTAGHRSFLAIAGTPVPGSRSIIPGPGAGVACCTLTGALEQVEWKTISPEETGPFVKDLTYSPNGRFLAITGDGSYALVSTMSLKKKIVGSCYALAFATDCKPLNFVYRDDALDEKASKLLLTDRAEEGLYAIVDEKRRRLTMHSLAKENVELCSLKLIYTTQTLVSGPLLAVLAEDAVVFFDWSRSFKFLCQVNVTATSLIWSGAGDMLAITSPAETYILGINWGYITANIDNEEVYDKEDGLLNAVALLHVIDKEVESIAFNTDGTSILYCVSLRGSSSQLENSTSLIYQMSTKELISLVNVSSESAGISIMPSAIVVEGANRILGIGLVQPIKEKDGDVINLQNDQIIVLGTPIHNGSGSLHSNTITLLNARLDNRMIKLKQLLLEKKLQEALELARCFTENTVPAAHQLIKAGLSYEDVEGILHNAEQKSLIASYAGRVDIQLTLFPKSADYDSLEAKRKMGDLAFRSGYLEDAYSLYKDVENYPMCFLCAYIVGSVEKLNELSSLTTDLALKYRIACAIGNDKLAYQALDGRACSPPEMDDDKHCKGNPVLKYIFADNHENVADSAALLKEACDYLKKSGRLITFQG